MQPLLYFNRAKIKIIKATMALTGSILLFSLSDVFACHQWTPGKYYLAGHNSHKVSSEHAPKKIFGYSTQHTTKPTTASVYGTSDSTATSTDCGWRTSNIEKFFHESYLQIAEESAQGRGPHLEALASQVGCNAQQTVLLEKALQQNYHGVFTKDDINHSISEFYTVVNSDDQLAACWPKS
jgi:hypothetical protein